MKRVLITLLAIVFSTIVLVVALIFWADPNRFRQPIERLAESHNVVLNIDGDLKWRIWPNIGVTVGEVSVATIETPEEALATVGDAAFSLALMPLFSGEFRADEISLKNFSINLVIDTDGNTNWSSLVQQDTKQEEKSTIQAPQQLSLKIEKIFLQNGAIRYRNLAETQEFFAQDLMLEVTDVNTLGNPIALALATKIGVGELLPKTNSEWDIQVSHTMQISKNIDTLSIENGHLHLESATKKEAKISANYLLAAKNLQTEPQWISQWTIPRFNARTFLAAIGTSVETANPEALSSIALDAHLTGGTKSILADRLRIRVDNTEIEGTIGIQDIESQALLVNLKGNTLNADDYLPPPDPTSEKEAPPPQDTPLPLDAMRTLNLDALIAMDNLRVKDTPMQGVVLGVNAKNGAIRQTFAATSYEGKLNQRSDLKVAKDKADLTLDGNLQGFQVGPLIKSMQTTEALDLSGALNASLTAHSSGATRQQLLNQLQGVVDFSGAELRLAPLNIEEKFCKAVNFMTQKKTDVRWQDFTELRKFDGRVQWQKQVISLEKFSAGVAQLLVSSSGHIDLKENTYAFRLPITLESAQAAENYQGCQLSTANYWVDRGLSLLRCHGSLDAITPVDDCGVDSQGLKSLVKDFAEYKLKEKHGAKIDAAKARAEEKKAALKAEAEAKLAKEKAEAEKRLQEKENALQKKIDKKRNELFDKLREKLENP